MVAANEAGMSNAIEKAGGARALRAQLEQGLKSRWFQPDHRDDRGAEASDRAAMLRFRSDAAAIEENPVPLSAHAALYVILTLVGLAIAWSIFGWVDRIVVAPGKIASHTPMIVMQPFTTSRIQDIRIKTGDHVRKGQALVTFDPAFAQADVASLQQKVDSLTAQALRIETELTGGVFLAGPGDPPERLTQAQIFSQEMADYTAEMNQRSSRLAAVASQIGVDDQNLPGLRAQNDMAQHVVGIQLHLRDQKAAAELDVMRAQSNAIDADMKVRNILGDKAKLAEQRIEAEQERQAYLTKWRSDHNQQLVQTRQDLADARETLNKARRMRDFTVLSSPVDGIVLQVAARSVGSVLREAETLVTLVPDRASLFVEASVESRDVSNLKVGDPVRIKLESYPFQRYGTVEGTLTVISPDSMPIKDGEDEEKSKLVYRAQVRLNESVAQIARRGMVLRPGLVASAEIKTGKRSIASYILNPILRTADESLREP
jgi:hemolysin D